jgi:hypothetical protein
MFSNLITVNLYKCHQIVHRKELFQSQHLTLDEELNFSRLVMTRKPKSPDNFYHRQWLINQQSIDWLTDERFVFEIDLCQYAADRYDRNYYAWKFRSWLFDRKTDVSIDLYHEDIFTLVGWIQRHVSDYSACHHLQSQTLSLFRLIRKDGVSKDETARILEVLQEQFDAIDRLLQMYHNKECFYLHRRFLLQQLSVALEERGETKKSVRVQLSKRESEFVEQQVKQCESSERPQLTAIVAKHVRWLHKMLLVSIDADRLDCILGTNQQSID